MTQHNNRESLTEPDVKEYNLSMAHAAMSFNLQDIDQMLLVLDRLYFLEPRHYELIESGQRIMARLIARTNRAQIYLKQELNVNVKG